MKCILLFLVLIIVGCSNESSKELQPKEVEIQDAQNNDVGLGSVDEVITVVKSSAEIDGLGNLCNSSEECVTFCEKNPQLCNSYCDENSENKICRSQFSFEHPDENNHQNNRNLAGGMQYSDCSDEDVSFDYAPVNLEKTKIMVPLGLMSGSHVTPVDHHYFQDFDNTKVNIEVYSPGKGIITSISHMPKAAPGEDYRLVIEHSCSVSSVYIHIHTLANRLKKLNPDSTDKIYPNIEVGAGELLGYFATNVDYNIVDENFTLEGFVNPESYEGEPWKIHVPNTFDYFNEPVKSQLIEKNIRTAEPIQGKIDYDVKGKIVGNWFVQNTNGYSGTQRSNYWSTHLTIAYDYIDPTRIVLSIPNFNEKDSVQYAIKGNNPDPGNVGVEEGIVKMELIRYDYKTDNGAYWDRRSLEKGIKTIEQGEVLGVAITQMLDDNLLKFEVFPGKSADEVEGFTPKALIYER